jgi:multidrug efflux pump subunit AcrA (membrane-fusion protein)
LTQVGEYTGAEIGVRFLTRIFSFRSGSLNGVVVVCAIVLLGSFGWLYTLGAQTDAGKQQTKGPLPIPVTIQTIQNSDFPVYLNGLGIVQPYNTVTVRSRVDGQVNKVGFRQGQMVNEGDLLVQIDPRPFQAALDMAQAKKVQDEANLKNAQLDLERFSTLAKQDYASRQARHAASEGRPAQRTPVIALSSDSTKTLGQGHLALVDNQVDQASGTIHMKATFQNKDDALWPGLSVATRLLVDTRKNVLVAPNDAIQHGPNGLYAFVLDKDSKVEKRDIEVGEEGASQTVVRKGLASGDRVVTSGQYRLTEGALVNPRNVNPSPSPDKEAANTPQKDH